MEEKHVQKKEEQDNKTVMETTDWEVIIQGPETPTSNQGEVIKEKNKGKQWTMQGTTPLQHQYQNMLGKAKEDGKLHR